jgi:hypothetical protein
MMSGYTFDAGALIALERNDRTVIDIVAVAKQFSMPIRVPAGALGQVWRDGARQARLAALLARKDVVVEPLDDMRARAAGRLCGARGTSDVIDASVVLCARVNSDRVVTSDPRDLSRLDPMLVLIVV